MTDNGVIQRIARRAERPLNRLLKRGDGSEVANYTVTKEQAEAAGGRDTDLGRLFFEQKGRSVYKWTHYLPAYDEQFAPYRDGFPLPDGSRRPLRMLEIGVLDGGSLRLWRNYFGPLAEIVGVDINPNVEAIDDPDLTVRIGSQDDPAFLRDVVAEMGGVDIVLDDGSHVAKHQRASFETLFPLLSDGGLYAVEDLHTSYWAPWGGGFRRRGTFIETVKTLIDDMHGWYHREGDKVGVSAASSIPKITLYDSMVFVSKAPRQRPAVVQFGERLTR